MIKFVKIDLVSEDILLSQVP